MGNLPKYPMPSCSCVPSPASHHLISSHPPSFADEGQIFHSPMKRSGLCIRCRCRRLEAATWVRMGQFGFYLSALLLGLLLLWVVVVRGRWRRRRTVGFFHPFTVTAREERGCYGVPSKPSKRSCPDLNIAFYTRSLSGCAMKLLSLPKYCNYMGMLAVEGSYDKIEALLSQNFIQLISCC